MSARPFYEMVYHVEGYTLADAFRPYPGWGTRRFTVKAADLGEHTRAELLRAAHDGAPERYRLTSVSIYEPGQERRVLWSTPPCHLAAVLASRRKANASGQKGEDAELRGNSPTHTLTRR